MSTKIEKRREFVEALPERFVYHLQPYGTYELVDLRLGQVRPYTDPQYHNRGKVFWCADIVGTVAKGSTTSRIFHHTSTRDATGERMEVYGVSLEDLQRGKMVTVAM